MPPATNVAPRQRHMPRFGKGTNGLPVLPALPGLPTLPAPATPTTPATPPATAASNNIAAPALAGSASAGTEIPAYSYNFQGVDVNQVLDLYADLVGRTILRAGLPQASIVLHTQSLLTRSEAIQALQAVLALNGISLINVGDKFVKALPSTDANTAAAPLDYIGCDQFAGAGVIRNAHRAVEIRQAQRDGANHPAFWQTAEFRLCD